MKPELRILLQKVIGPQIGFVAAACAVIGAAIGVSHNWQVGLKAALIIFLFMLVIGIWISWDVVRETASARHEDDLG